MFQLFFSSSAKKEGGGGGEARQKGNPISKFLEEVHGELFLASKPS